MHLGIHRNLTGVALIAACSVAIPAAAEPIAAVYDAGQIRRTATTHPESGIVRTEDIRTDKPNPLLRLIGANGIEVFVQGAGCEGTVCRKGRFVALIEPPAGVDRQQLVDRHNESPRWAVASIKDGTMSLRAELLYDGGISDTNLAQYLRSIMHHASRLKAGQP